MSLPLLIKPATCQSGEACRFLRPPLALLEWRPAYKPILAPNELSLLKCGALPCWYCFLEGFQLPCSLLPTSLARISKLSFVFITEFKKKKQLSLLALGKFCSFLYILHLIHTFIMSLAMLILMHLFASLFPVIIYELLEGK